MPSQRSRPFVGLAAICAAVTVTACSGLGDPDAPAGPPRLEPDPRPDVASAMVDGTLEPPERLDTCGLLDLSTVEVIALTNADMPLVEPMGLDELGMPCTYGGPGSPERLQASLEAEDDEETEEDAATNGAEATDADAPTDAAEPTAAEPTAADDPAAADDDDEIVADELPVRVGPTTPETTSPDASELDPLPPAEIAIADTVAAGVVKPLSGAPEALATQPVMLGSRYACSEVRGQDAETVPGELVGVPEAPEPVAPDLASPYIDCIAAPTGGGVEVHTLFVADNDLWHLTFIRPGTPRSPEADAEALEGLHRVAARVLD